MAQRTLPGLGLTGYWDLGYDGWKNEMDANLRLLSLICQASFKDFVSSEPGSPSNGDIYIFTTGAEANKFLLRDNAAWVYLAAKKGTVAFNEDNGLYYAFDGTNWNPLITEDASDAYQDPVRIFTTSSDGNVDWTTGGLITLQGETLEDGDRVGLGGQTDPIENLIYIARSGTWDRAPGWDDADPIASGTLVTIQEGTNGGSTAQITTPNPFVIGTDGIAWKISDVKARFNFMYAAKNAASYSVLTTDNRRWLNLGRAGNQTITLPAHTTTAVPLNSEMIFVYGGSGTKTITVPAGVTLNGVDNGSETLTDAETAMWVKKISKTAWQAIKLGGGSGTSYTDEMAQDAAASMLTSGKYVGVTPTYDDTGNTLALVANHRFLKQPNVPKRNFVTGIPAILRTEGATNTWYDVAWSPDLGLFAAVASSGTGNRVMTSPDGITWTARTSAADNEWRSIAWSSELGLFVAVANSGTGNRVMTSPDGITWTARTSAADNRWLSVVWARELGLFVAVAISGTGNRVMTSPDGITWTSRAEAATNNWRGVAWSPTLRLLVAIANSGTGNRVMTSPDGITWTSRTSAADNAWQDVCWAAELGLFVAVANSGTGNRVMTSPDGITWTARTSAGNYGWAGVAWAPELGLLCAVANATGTGDRLMTSPDGITWTLRTSAADNAWQSLAWSPQLEIFCAVAASGIGRVMTTMSGLYYGRDVEVHAAAASDETTALTTGTAKTTFRVPVNFRCTEIYASLTTAQSTGSLLTVDVNADGVSILSTKLTFDNTEKTTRTAVTPPVLSTNRLVAGTEITVDIDTVGDGTATGLKVYLVGFGFK